MKKTLLTRAPANLLQRLAILFFILLAGNVFSQSRTISGKVEASDSKEPLPGATVFIKGSTQGATTDLDGNYILSIPGDDVILVFSFIGYTPQEVLVGNQTMIDISLLPDNIALEEIVVIGYGSQKAKDLTAPVVSVKGDELSRQVSSNPMQALQGKVSGVQIINTGIPGQGPSVKIRGVGSIGDYANPLYVVDGIFTENIDFLSAGDIEDLTVLKDASAAAIYGVRAANGVILVTTKKGRSQTPVVNYDGYYGLQIPVNIMPLATTREYITLLNEANANATGYIPKDPNIYPASTDWYKELVRIAGMMQHTLDISGASERTSYSFGGSYLYQEGIMDTKNDFERFNMRARVDQKVNNRLNVGVNSVVTRYDKHIPNDGAFFGAFVNPPVYPVMDENNTQSYPVHFGSPQSYGFGNQYGNPVAAAYYSDQYEKGNRLLFSAYAEFQIIEKHLNFKTSYNQELNQYNFRNYTPEFNVGGSQGVRKSTLVKTYGNGSRQIIDNLLTYNSEVGKHRFSILLGQSTRMEKVESLSGSALDVPGLDEQSKYITTGSFRDRNAWDGADVFNGVSVFTRSTYNYNGKYLATLTFRADASSKYQEKWGYFPSIGLGWIVTQENFLRSHNWIQFLKLRASWGLLGNDNVPANSAVILGSSGAGSSGIFGDRLVDGIGAQTVIQNYLQWEIVNEFDLGLDFTLLHGKLSGDMDYYHRITHNVVFYAPIATGGGVAELLGNNGKVLNNGLELSLDWRDKLTDKIQYTLGFNATTIHNEVLELQGRDYIPGGSVRGNFSTRTQVGHPIGSFYGYEIEGVYESESQALLDPIYQPIRDKGFFRYKDQNGDKKITDADKVFLGSAIPKLISGFDFGISRGRLDLNVSIQGQWGNKILNAKRMNRDVFADGNYDKDFFENRWTSANKSDEYPSAEAYNFSFTQQANTFFVEKGAYIRIQNVHAGYTIGSGKYFQKARIYLTAQRPFTYFAYHGFTPEIGGSPISSGIDNSVHPMQAIYTMGINIQF